ncbi:MAG: IS5 family transposase [Rhodobacteraceae bacterium]|nr:IS5 family transposase [Paracoccaceae bacterium]
MLHKFNASRRHTFAKTRYRVTNWAEYNESLRRRGDLTVWIETDALKLWTAPRRTSRGDQQRYSDIVIVICLTLSLVYKQPLRQTQGLMRGIVRRMGLDIPVPDFSTLSRRGRGLSLPIKPQTRRSEPVHLLVDRTGLKIFGEGERLREKHKTKTRCKSWRKLHLGLDLLTGEIVCADLTLDDVGDPTALPGLLDQIDAPVSRFLVDGACDGALITDLLNARFGGAVEVTIPPPKNAVLSPQSMNDLSQRDCHITEIHAHGRIAWQSSSGYNQRSRAEAQMGRWKGVIGAKLKAQRFENQKTEVKIAVSALNRTTELGRAEFEVVS